MQVKEFHFPLEVDWLAGRKVVTRVSGKHEVEVMPPPVFKGTDPSVWSPEDFFVASAASCLAVTLTGLAEREGLVLRRLHVSADGVAGVRDDDHFGFRRIEMGLAIVTDLGQEALALELAHKAEEACLVTASLDLPASLEVEVATAELQSQDDPAAYAESI
jgi:organic hydroperoxide reductase OsmC/OhrA